MREPKAIFGLFFYDFFSFRPHPACLSSVCRLFPIYIYNVCVFLFVCFWFVSCFPPVPLRSLWSLPGGCEHRPERVRGCYPLGSGGCVPLWARPFGNAPAIGSPPPSSRLSVLLSFFLLRVVRAVARAPFRECARNRLAPPLSWSTVLLHLNP